MPAKPLITAKLNKTQEETDLEAAIALQAQFDQEAAQRASQQQASQIQKDSAVAALLDPWAEAADEWAAVEEKQSNRSSASR